MTSWPIELELVDDAGHFIVDEKPALVAERITRFFGRPGSSVHRTAL